MNFNREEWKKNSKTVFKPCFIQLTTFENIFEKCEDVFEIGETLDSIE